MLATMRLRGIVSEMVDLQVLPDPGTIMFRIRKYGDSSQNYHGESFVRLCQRPL